MERLLGSLLKRVVHYGSLEVQTASGAKICCGSGHAPAVSVRLADTATEIRLLQDPSLAVGELYSEGRIILERGTLYDLAEICVKNVENLNQVPWLAGLERARHMLRRAFQRNNVDRAQRNVAHHYDLGEDFYALFLDADMQYSCAYFEHSDMSLDSAQRAKCRHIAAKLLIEPGHRVLDIGSGWGGLALYMASMCDADVTGITLSRDQLATAIGRSKRQMMESHAAFRLQDYRSVDERYDRIVSVGMFEHVGIDWYETYFKHIAQSLTSDGVALVHTIGRTDAPGVTNRWIEKYIFPGGYAPTLSEIIPAIERAGLLITDIEVLRLHYAETLKHWRARFHAQREAVLKLYDAKFFRMWDLYLATSEANFRLGYENIFQIQVTRKLDALPITRDYITAREHALAAREGRGFGLQLAGE